MSQQPRLPFPYRPEAGIVARHLQALAGALDWAAAVPLAQPWVQAVRDNPPPFWAMESLLKEYPISSAEGLALMRLAEALLRVPDAETAIALTADQLGRADFDGASDGMMARLSASAIALSKKFLPEDGQSSIMSKLGARTVVAATLRAVQLLGRQFVLGQNIGEAMDEARDAQKKVASLRVSPPGRPKAEQPPEGAAQPAGQAWGLRFSYDMLGEGARTDADALHYLASYEDAIKSIAARADRTGTCEQNDGISIKLSALHPRYEDAQHARVLADLVPRVWGLCELAARANINLTIDAEEVDRLELSLDVFEALAALVAQQQPQWQGFGLALQAYQTRALELVGHVITLARKYRLRFMCRLVKGAYWDSEIKRAQELGLPHYPVFTHKHHTDVSYLACAQALLAAPDAIYPQFAGHNAGTIAAIIQMAARNAVPFELQRLHGMGEGVFREVLKNPQISCRVYAPVGAHRDLLAYLVRRLLENGANSSFVHQLADESVGMDVLLTSPLRMEPESSLPLPPALYGSGRPNSEGLDLTVESMRAPLLAALQTTQVPVVPEFDAKLATSAVAVGADSYQKWSKVEVAERAAVLRRASDALQQQMPAFCALLVKEAFKTWGDAVSEVREAIDFLRYYAGEAERIMAPIALPGPTGETNELRLSARGVWVCISPWNFPLAIFTGQVAAALSTGNAVLAKPAEQTPGVAWEAVKLLHAAGVPEGALQLLHGPGETVGAALVAAPGVAGVVFTGSTEVAKIINRALAAKDGAIVPLIAETGGINAMLVDSSALPEQVVDAVVQSAFRSAGQRCSALRLLCVHEGIADKVVAMIQGALQELAVGDPTLLSTDVGPVIDREAFDNIQNHLQRLDSTSKVLPALSAHAQTAPDSIANLVLPSAFEVASLAEVKDEIFGPVLQIVRWSGEPQKVIAQINALGYGLTLSIQTRIDSRAQALAAAAHVGNIYINRNMIGAVVGSQPFGGEGLSGTGPKAGGPHYLYRFCAEQTVTVNTTAAGGNAALLSGA
ncbi:MAG TPA: L-glutamate gamma-semialdehyde dehydrogenase [Polaromonas sp.]|uniref:L-glutamate gamma-semialdehyde dehydrogenase n=1 Tax=unclassified Polaromonas TaxID=2638319 RepID=UPI000BD8999B|nr:MULTISPECIES: L-glutamate gamma-semialdehyde dehydrogenase [unclassified Polaromonas]OYY32998.1 MAG: delta-1-pyrroline-5-carboxylate dehydrogenase [Polaromonas sp. 35-63-35]OYZ17177.1 MAG: delta-1-pyrroline-5-carboxylate dehydrogenase [Polaromonas sp. 16-63-31]OYZ76431.1 MAG: delta-1-pyrroline-5-carboxylate dehydrogenase [Polaromonas sp. 24-63-21]OZA47627.1 MAG: delta-1-pyrroline-5-carboxylate dehydrogenase [Polaromonas sp. 17-63-33]OZA85705.1 MAG: delta-1-pyrroline-5-carboxylate dehydrogen